MQALLLCIPVMIVDGMGIFQGLPKEGFWTFQGRC